MKKYLINGHKVAAAEFDRQLRRCLTKNEAWAAGAASGYFDAEQYVSLADKLQHGWTYRCIYLPAEIDLTFKIEVKL